MLNDLKRWTKERDHLIRNPSAKEAARFHKRWGDPSLEFSVEGLLGGIYKARVTLGFEVKQSLDWLHAHGMAPDVPPEFMPPVIIPLGTDE